ncbi:LysM peptidoglycan-binding domain-containing M23 family metallopeptidase [Salipiger abyssi]|uniref:LysM peptidoglycan-binding domain-containing M23 family metallopeptidase n=1 Tax=Salipiger abyssi TaxID=1250539 RepID=UPI001A8F5E20|nr:LysM peptidoglycan-binding domain-containing M23 family metallopeptidase [Salipiger abyssi]MBN9889785.1 LysM peptidoglycan-binding domain-containing M23 family metallopeptidase [Salipiger abyssi]
MDSRSLPLRFGAPLAFAAALGACSGPFDYDMRGRMGGQVDTSQAALAAVADRPQPDDRGIISYPNYQVAVARRGDTATDLANRIGLPAGELARYNGIQPDDRLRAGEIIALPRRVSEPSPATGAATTGPIRPAAEVDITTLAGNAIDSAPATAPAQTQQPQPEVRMQNGVEPIRHKVARGETAYTIARLYNITPRALADWNALDSDYSLREGQYLLIPVVEKPAASSSEAAVTPPPGAGSQTPEPPSASQPLPKDEPSVAESAAAAATSNAKPVANIGQSQSAPSGSSSAKMSMPVNGSIIREYAKGKNEGIDISASAGTAVKAAASGTVAAITTNTDNVQILVIRHPDEVLSIYTHVDQLSVQKGDAVSRGQSIGKVRAGDPSFLHFEVRKGFDSVDPMTYLR